MDTTTHLKLNKPAPEDFYDVGDFNENADKIDSEFIKTLRKKKVTELPSTTREYRFDSNTEFTAVERCTLGLVTEGADKFLRVTTSDNTANKYAIANLNFADIGQTADTLAIEMDTRMPGGRWFISLVDLSKRPGESYRTTHDPVGVAFSCGTKDGTNYNVNNTNVFGSAFINTWLHMRLVVDVTAKTVTYEIRDRSADTVLAAETVSFRDSGTDKITGIELYSYTQTTIDVDNIKVTAGYDVEENVMYCVGSGELYDTYVYFDGEPMCISSQTELSEKANIASPAFTGSPTAPTPGSNDSSTKIATTAFVMREIERLNAYVSSMIEGKDVMWVRYIATEGSQGYSVSVTVIFNGEERYSETLQGTYPPQEMDSTYLRIAYAYEDDEMTVILQNSTSGHLPSGGPSYAFSKAVSPGEYSEVLYVSQGDDGYAAV